MQMPFELVGMDYPTHELNTEAYRELSPFEQIPAIDDNGIVLSESAAILIYLAKKANKLMPSDPAGEAQVVRWRLAAMSSVEMPLMSILFIDLTADDDTGAAKPRQFMADWAKRLFTGLERWLEGREFVATDTFTVADILMSHVLTEVRDERLLEPYGNVRN